MLDPTPSLHIAIVRPSDQIAKSERKTILDTRSSTVRSTVAAKASNGCADVLPVLWVLPESIQSIICSEVVGISTEAAFVLSQSVTGANIKTLEYRNGTLDEICCIKLPGDPVISAPVSPADDQFVKSFISEYVAGLPACTRRCTKAGNPLLFANKICPPSFCVPAARILGTCLVLWLCIVDDLSKGENGELELDNCLSVLSGTIRDRQATPTTPCLQVLEAFQNVIRGTRFGDSRAPADEEKPEEWKADFWREVHRASAAYKADQQLGRDGAIISMSD